MAGQKFSVVPLVLSALLLWIATERTPAAEELPADPGLGMAPKPTFEESASTRDQLAIEVEKLRLEIADLKRKIEEHSADGRGPRAFSEASSGALSTASRPLASPPTESTAAPADPNVRVVAVGIASLLLGWTLGAVFSRRRSRSQRNRLRF